MPAIHHWQNQFDRNDSNLEDTFKALGMEWKDKLKTIVMNGIFTLHLTDGQKMNSTGSSPGFSYAPDWPTETRCQAACTSGHQHLPHHGSGGHAPRNGTRGNHRLALRVTRPSHSHRQSERPHCQPMESPHCFPMTFMPYSHWPKAFTGIPTHILSFLAPTPK